jgi:mono/diheme cytochrome c family protein
MRRIAYALLALATAASIHEAAGADAFPKADPVAGKRLFDEAKCNGCHDKIMKGDGNRIFTRPDRKIGSAPALEKMVRFCIDRTGASLFPEDAEHIAAYLNEHFYKFK